MTTHVLTVPIPRPPMSLNQQRRAHWTKVRTAKTQTEFWVRQAARQARLPAMVQAHVEVVWFAPDKRRRDADSLAPFLKGCLDALVAGGWLPDDDHRHVPTVTMSIEVDTADPRIEVRVTDLQPEAA